MARVVVVGAGMGGLAAAARLAAQGHRVTVCESSATYGGQVGYFERDGFGFDLGPGYLSLPAVYRDLFLKTGSALEENVGLAALGPVCRYRFPDKTDIGISNGGRGRTVASIDSALGDGRGAEWGRFLDKAGDIWDVTRRPLLENPLDGFTGLVRQALKARQRGGPQPWRSLRGLVRRHLHDERLRRYAERFATAAGSDPRSAPAALAVLPYVDHTFGIWYVRGGMRRLADALFARCEERGVVVRFGVRVTGVVVEGGRAQGVRTGDGAVIDADVVVSDADARLVYGEMLDAPSATAQLRRAAPSPGVFTILLALRGADGPDGPSGPPRVVLFGPDGDAELDTLFSRTRRVQAPQADPTITVHAPDDAALRPDCRHAAWRVCVEVPRHSADGETGTLDWNSAGLADSYADTVLATLADRGIDVRDRLLWREVRTPADAQRAYNVPGGSAHGLSMSGGRSAATRPNNSAPVPGVFLVGGTVHPGPGLPSVGMSAAIVAQLIGAA